MKAISALAFVLTLGLGLGAHASSHYQICSSADGLISVVNGNVTVKDGIGDVGPAKSQTVIKQIARKDESCVDGPNYSSTIETLEKVVYVTEESGPATAVFVICTESLTGIMTNGSKCK